ncbi:MAG: glucose 1-dehydrogenase [Aphanocapsa lilacina HA4352-LM1]|jgi:NAD(P)-dependent dehydrogenase (short-subunit alcohol dehydrogenase family)|nr:glucose 1-dehydrogenase [Aphanocapsa lilacina HA4352-LM1]
MNRIASTAQLQIAPPVFARPLEDKVAIVTGASSGIGRATALELARRGAKVVASARRVGPTLELVEAIRAEGHEATFVQADVTDEAYVERLVAEAIATYGKLDIAFNNAGTEGVFAPLLEQTKETYDLVFDANVRSVFYSMKHQAQAMLCAGGGVIVNNASMGGVIGFENAALYIATKHAVLGMTKSAALEWYRRGVRVNAICPGIIDTPFQDRIWPSTEAKNSFANATVAGRAGTAEEMAKVVAFLVSEDASFVSGHGLLADGGYSIA